MQATATYEDAIFVATDLSVLNDAFAPADDNEVAVEGRIYRLLDPEYYAWLRSRMDTAQSAHRKGKLPAETFDALRMRFNAVHDQAIGLYGEPALLDAVRGLDAKSYAWPGRVPERLEDRTHADAPEGDGPTTPQDSREEAPAIQPGRSSSDSWSDHAYPAEDPNRFKFNQRVTPHALDQVDAIREQALACSWTEAELYQTRGRFAFPCGGDYGLVCFIHDDQRLGAVADRAIEIICKGGHSLHFYRRQEAS